MAFVRNSSQQYPVNAGVPQGSIVPPTFLVVYINDLPDDGIYNIAIFPDEVFCDISIYADDTTLYWKCDQASNLWQQVELASEIESDLQLWSGTESSLFTSLLEKLNLFGLTILIILVLLMGNAQVIFLV